LNNNERNNINNINDIYFRLPKPRLPRTRPLPRPRVLTPILIKGCLAWLEGWAWLEDWVCSSSSASKPVVPVPGLQQLLLALPPWHFELHCLLATLQLQRPLLQSLVRQLHFLTPCPPANQSNDIACLILILFYQVYLLF